MSDEPRDRDSCPHCGTQVRAEGSFGIGGRREGESLPEANHQARRCPNCKALLRRATGGRWSVVPEPWLVTVTAEPHNAVLDSRGKLIGMLVRGTSVEPIEGGLGPGRYTFEVRATDREAAIAAIETAAKKQNVSIQAVEDATTSAD